MLQNGMLMKQSARPHLNTSVHYATTKARLTVGRSMPGCVSSSVHEVGCTVNGNTSTASLPSHTSNHIEADYRTTVNVNGLIEWHKYV